MLVHELPGRRALFRVVGRSNRVGARGQGARSSRIQHGRGDFEPRGLYEPDRGGDPRTVWYHREPEAHVSGVVHRANSSSSFCQPGGGVRRIVAVPAVSLPGTTARIVTGPRYDVVPAV